MTTPPDAPRRSSLTSTLVLLLGFCSIVSISINWIHESTFSLHTADMAIARAMHDFKTYKKSSKVATGDTTDGEEGESNVVEMDKVIAAPPKDDTPSALAGLNCDAFGGPSREQAQEMVYWSDIPSDSRYVSPFHEKRSQYRRYLTFEPDGGGWNNIRMSMETVVAMAHAMGRTLVLPPEQRMYLLRKDLGKQRTHFSFAHFFPMLEIAEEHEGLHVITMQEFLETEAMTGNLRNKETKQMEFPPHNRTNWNGEDVTELKEWLRNVTYTPLWKPGSCLAAFPASGDAKEVDSLHEMMEQVVAKKTDWKDFEGKPVPVHAPAEARMAENLAGRKELCIYSPEMQEELVVHFMCYHKMRIRLLVHFYAFLFFENWKADLWMKRFIRDHVRYVDEIQCAAARVVSAVRDHARKHNPAGNGDFDSFHIRRGDFQFKTTRIDAQEIYDNVHDVLTENKTVFIATDERNKSFFDPLKKHYDVVFLDDFMDELKGVNSNLFGMIDQLIASRGNVFIGCWFSTFTGYINRLRGYHSLKSKLPGYEDGALPSTYYYATKDKKYEMTKFMPVKGGFFSREYPTSWRGIDEGIEELHIK